jgi:hypothetical protein
MRIGTDSISSEQMRLLDRARMGRRDEILEGLLRIVRDPDIRDEREELHPDWRSIYESNRGVVGHFLPAPATEEIEAFFAKLRPFDQQICELDLAKLRTTFLLVPQSQLRPASRR